MTVVYQGSPVETSARTIAELLASRAVDAAKAIVEYAGEVYAPGANLAALELKPGAAVDVFKLTAGG